MGFKRIQQGSNRQVAPPPPKPEPMFEETPLPVVETNIEPAKVEAPEAEKPVFKAVAPPAAELKVETPITVLPPKVEPPVGADRSFEFVKCRALRTVSARGMPYYEGDLFNHYRGQAEESAARGDLVILGEV